MIQYKKLSSPQTRLSKKIVIYKLAFCEVEVKFHGFFPSGATSVAAFFTEDAEFMSKKVCFSAKDI
jgi:hypothetical protein